MKILIDGHMLGKQEKGNERYIKDMALSLKKNADSNVKIKIVVSKEYYQNQKDFLPNDLIVLPSENNFYRLFFLQKYCQDNKIDIIHSTYISPFFLKNTASVITVHDLSFKKYPQFYSFRENLIFRYLLPLSLKQAKAIIVPSKFTKDELIKYFPSEKNKIFILYEGPNQSFFPIKKQQAKKIIKNKYHINSPFILTINSKDKKKNINQVLKISKKIKIVIVGSDNNIKNKKQKNLIFLKNIPNDDLNLLFNACEFFISLSFYEGFNLPIIEALKTRTPVIASDIPVHRELYDNLITYYNEKMFLKNLYQLKNKTKDLKKILNKFSWINSAKKLLMIYKNILYR